MSGGQTRIEILDELFGTLPGDAVHAGTRLKQLREYPGYFAGSDGYIWSYRAAPYGIRTTPLRLSSCDGGHGYLQVGLRRAGGVGSHLVAGLIATAFHGYRPCGYECCHNNGDRSDNRPNNLRWDTILSNRADKHLHGTTARGERNANAELSASDVVRIREQYSTGTVSQQELGAAYGVVQTTIGAIVRGETWKHVGGPISREMANPLAKLRKEDIPVIRRLHREGQSIRGIARKYEVSHKSISNVIHGKTYRGVR